MKKLHLHIGSAKTGTTSIQQTFYKNDIGLSQQGYLYSGNSFNDHLFFLCTKSPKEDWPRQFRKVSRTALQEKFNNYLISLEKNFKSEYEHQIISTEYLFVHKSEYIRNIIAYLEKFFSEIKIYVFVRSPVAYYGSLQQQMIKARSFITSPATFRYNFKEVIKSWGQVCEVEVIGYKAGMDSCKRLSQQIGIDISKFVYPDKQANTSISVEQMALLEKIQNNLYQKYEDRFKYHLGVIQKINAPFTSRPRLKPEIQSLLFLNHQEDLEWLKDEYKINFSQDYPKKNNAPFPPFEQGRATVREVYKVEDERAIEKYEALVIDALLKKLVKKNLRSSQTMR